MNKKIDLLLDANVPVLVPYELLEEYNDFLNDELRNVLRANCIRRYLEGIIDIFFKEVVIQLSGMTQQQWNDYNLNVRVQKIGKYYDKKIEDKFHELKKTGNKGSHFGEKITENDIKDGVKIVLTIVEDIFIKYFDKYPFGTENPVLTLLSALPPYNRVYILNELWKRDKKNTVIVDKLSMAYLKSGNKDKSLTFLKELKENNYITEDYYFIFIQKIEDLSKHMSKFDISKNILDTKRIFNMLCTDFDYRRYSEFTKIFSILLKGYDMVYDCPGAP